MTKIGVLSLLLALTAVTAPAAEDLVGLWEGKRTAGPTVQGNLFVSQSEQGWHAEIAGHRVTATQTGNRLTFTIPGNRGSFHGWQREEQILGHWTQPGTLNNGMPHASPVRLQRTEPGLWRGQVVPLLDEFSLYLPVWKNEDGTFGAFLRNPDRGFGVFLNVDQVEHHSESVRWMGRFFRSQDHQMLVEASYEPGRMAVNIRGNLYDMRKGNANSYFYARGKAPKPYGYKKPPQLQDGWKTGNLAESGIDPAAIGRFIEEVILPPADSIDDPYVHGFLIARSGTLVLEEYFHGFHRDKAHDTRSASKSLASVLAGAASYAGLGVSEDTPVYDSVDTAYLQGLKDPEDPRRARLQLRHLLTMSSGLECDDSDGQSRGNEGTMQSQEEMPDWYRWTLTLAMVREPGQQAVYCSGGANLIGAVVAGATGRNLSDLMLELIAEPLAIDHYYLNLSPDGVPYMGGGIYWKPRDFMKLAQVILDDGVWNGQRIISERWAKLSRSKLYTMNNKGYGYTWWTIDYPYGDQTVTAFFAAGNGGQIILGIPALDLVIAFYAGNYSHPTLFRIQEQFVPEYILPAVDSGTR